MSYGIFPNSLGLLSDVLDMHLIVCLVLRENLEMLYLSVIKFHICSENFVYVVNAFLTFWVLGYGC